MSNLRRSLLCVLLPSLAVLSGCGVFADSRYTPRKGTEGGFSVLVDGAERPAMGQVTADIGAFAQSRGFVRQASLPPPFTDPLTREPIPRAPERYARGTLELEVSYQPTTHRVSAYLHDSSSARDRKLIRRFYQDFHKEYAPRYGANDPISESAFSSDQRNNSYDDSSTTPTYDPRGLGQSRGQ